MCLDAKQYGAVTGVLFGIIALVHLWRSIAGWPVLINGTSIPLWASWIALIVAGSLAYNGLKLSR